MTTNGNDVKVPQFCTVDGRRLVEKSSVQGFDAYTGEAQLSKQLICPQGKTLMNNNRHATWTLDGNTWVSN